METQTNTSVNVTKLQSLYNINDEAKDFLDILSQKGKTEDQTTVDSILSATHFARAHVIQILKTLESAGCGVFKNGRRQHPSRFVWSSNMSDVGKAARGEKGEVESLALSEEIDELKKPRKPPKARGRRTGSLNRNAVGETKRHTVALNPGFTASMVLPRKLSKSEARRIISYVSFLAQA